MISEQHRSTNDEKPHTEQEDASLSAAENSKVADNHVVSEKLAAYDSPCLFVLQFVKSVLCMNPCMVRHDALMQMH